MAKIIIYIDFCINESISKLLRVAYFWRQAPQNLSGSDAAYKEGHSTRHVRGIFKKAYLRL